LQKNIPDILLDHIIGCYTQHREVLNGGKKSHQEIWDEFCACLGRPLDINILEQVFLNTPVNTAMLSLAERLKKNYRLAIITNNNKERLAVLTKSMNLLERFDAIITSADTGAMKGDKKIFEVALQTLGVTADESVFIDNDQECLVVPKAMGFKTYFHDHEKNDIAALEEALISFG
jgi:putative hydrolase of the HAD superfamily